MAGENIPAQKLQGPTDGENRLISDFTANSFSEITWYGRYYNLFCSTLKTKLKALSCNRSVTFSSLKCLHDPPEITKTEDVRQCALCQQCGDSAPSVSFYIKAFGA